MTTAASVRHSWKRTERRIAAMLGGVRVPVTGRQRGSAPDIRHDWLAIEVKSRKDVPEWLLDGMRQARAAQRSGQLPIVVVHQVGGQTKDDLVALRLEDWCDWFGGRQEEE